ncbi:MAG TPA: hypothetical protein VFS00_28885, partial [Polyangiaceae bacterium]|nr:hypothetical protein [Polyangiaceae bacterium]
ETRAKLFHLFVQAHGQMRRAVVYLRWDEGDADTLWPSLFRGRPRKARGPSEPAAPEPSEPSGPSEPSQPAAPEPSEPSEPAAPEPAVAE